MALSDVIKKRRSELGLTLLDIAKKMEVNEATVQRWESGNIKSLRQGRLAQLAEILKVSPAELMGWTNERQRHLIPVLGDVPAGIPIEAATNIIDYEEISEEMARAGDHFALRIRGDSMEPKFSEGDVVIVRKQEAVDNGQVAVVMVNGNDATVKKFYKTAAGVMLVGNNPSFVPLTYTPEQVEQLPVRVIGRVVELRAKF